MTAEGVGGRRARRRGRRSRPALALLGVAGLLAALAPRAALAQAEPDEPVLAVLPFQVHSAKPLDYLGESVANLIRSRLEASGQVSVLDAAQVSQRVDPDAAAGASEAQLRALARDLGSGFVVSGSTFRRCSPPSQCDEPSCR